MCGFRYRCSNTGLQLLRRGFGVSLIPKDVKVMVRIKVTRLGELGLTTRKDHGLAESLGVSSFPVRSGIFMGQVCDEETRGLNLDAESIINQPRRTNPVSATAARKWALTSWSRIGSSYSIAMNALRPLGVPRRSCSKRSQPSNVRVISDSPPR